MVTKRLTFGFRLVSFLSSLLRVIGRSLFTVRRWPDLTPNRESFLRFLLLGLLVLSCVVFYVSGTSFRLDRNATDRTRYHAIPVAQAQILYGWPHDYTSFKSLARPYQSVGNIDDLIVRTRPRLSPSDISDKIRYFWLCDDRGFSDFVNISFRIFGHNMRGLYKGFFLFVAISLCFALLSMWKDSFSLAVLVIFIVSYLGLLPLFPTADTSSLWHRVPALHITETRALECLGLLFVLQCTCVVIRNLRVTVSTWLGLVGQALMFAFLYSCRSSLGWIVLAVIVLSFFGLSYMWLTRVGDYPARNVIYLCLLPIILAGSVFLFKGWHHLVEHPYYLSEGGQRTFYHNALMGLYRSKLISDRYQIHGPDDRDAIEAVNLWLARSGRQSHVADTLLYALGGYGSADWAKYEKDAKSLYMHIILTEPLESVKNYSRKLLRSLKDTRAGLASIVQLDAKEGDKRKELHPHPFGWHFLLLAVLPTLVICGSSRDSFLFLVIIAVLYLFALIPSVVF